ncbi:L-histidine N(alpha)-methyltransferase [Hydrogenophaga sp.]|uniref:L-histidine N(alpha)-methyltransferase n=1 Tax=Hydrogenophaga sp. TaxID=1904254 RepID=UPI003566372E
MKTPAQALATPREPSAASNPSEAPLDQALVRMVLDGLGQAQKSLSAAWFYDDEGSRLFQRIMALPEYYLTRAEHSILRERGDELAQLIAPDARAVDLIELGSGDGEKSLTLCTALQNRDAACTYHPMDVSALALRELRQRFAQRLPACAVQPLCGNYFEHWPTTPAEHRRVVLLLGSNLGNFSQSDAVALLRRIRSQLRPGDALLLGLDLMKDPQVVLAAYNDSQGVTARFNLNLLTRLNRELGMDFDLAQFRNYASYSPLDGAARSFLVSQRAQRVHSSRLQRDFHFAAGETIYTEQSQKYNRAMLDQLAQTAGFTEQRLLTDAQAWYAVAVWQVPVVAPVPTPPPQA